MIQRVEALLYNREAVRLAPQENTMVAGVLMMLKQEAGETFVFFIKRAEDENDPFSGNMAFPGGRKEAEVDRDALDAAIRETWEETGIDLRQGGRLLGALDDVSHDRFVYNYLITPFVALAPPDPQIVLSSEVAEAVWVPLSFLREEGNWGPTLYENRSVRMWAEGFLYRHYFIWGITGGIVRHFLQVARSLFA